PRIPGVDGIVESAGRAHDGYGSVFQAVNLAESAGLVTRGHQEHVGSGFNLVRQGVVIGDAHRDLARNPAYQPGEHLFVQPVAAAQNHQVDRLEGQAVDDLPDQIKSLLCGKSRHDPDNGEPEVGALEAKTGQQILLAL